LTVVFGLKFFGSQDFFFPLRELRGIKKVRSFFSPLNNCILKTMKAFRIMVETSTFWNHLGCREVRVL